MNFNEIMGKINSVSLRPTLAMMMVAIISLTGCSMGEPVVVHPVEFAEPEEDELNTEDISEAEEAGIVFGNVNEESSEEAEDEEREGEEEFVLIEPEDNEVTEDNSGVVLSDDGRIVVDLIFFMGQSNMSGAGGDAQLAPYVEEGHAYEFRAISDPTRLYPIEEPFGKNESYIGGICDLPGAKKGSLVSAFANEYYALTKIPIVAVSASQGASTTEIWQSPGFQADMKERYARAVVWLESSGYYIRNRYAVWFQGESDAANHVDPDVYNTNMDNIIRPMYISGLNKVFIVTPGRTLSIKNYFTDIVREQIDMCKTSGYYALGTSLLADVSTEYMVDEWHYNQMALNLIGVETARSVACYTNERRERIDYNYLDDCTYIPDGFEYTGEEECEPMNLKDIQKILDDYYYGNDEDAEESTEEVAE